MRLGFVADPAKDDSAKIAEVWLRCEKASAKIPQAEFDKKHADFLRNLVCDASAEKRNMITKGIIRNWISDVEDRRDFSAQLARGLLGEDGKPCAVTRELDEGDKQKLRAAVLAGRTTTPAAASASSR